MKILFYLIAVVAIVAPFILWTLLIGMGCAYALNSSNCGPAFNDYLDHEFLLLGALPWTFGIALFVYVYRKGR